MKESYNRLIQYQSALEVSKQFMAEVGRKMFKMDEEHGKKKEMKKEQDDSARGFNG